MKLLFAVILFVAAIATRADLKTYCQIGTNIISGTNGYTLTQVDCVPPVDEPSGDFLRTTDGMILLSFRNNNDLWRLHFTSALAGPKDRGMHIVHRTSERSYVTQRFGFFIHQASYSTNGDLTSASIEWSGGRLQYKVP